MNRLVNYPIKYGVLELKNNEHYQDITHGFIVSKCYVIESRIKYDIYGNSFVFHQVLFPYDNYSFFIKELQNGRCNIGPKNDISFDMNGNPYDTYIINNIFDTYEDAKEEALDLNEKYKQYIINNNLIYNNVYNEYQCELLNKELDDKISLCNLYEELINNKTDNMDITNDKNVVFIKSINKNRRNI